jgi:Uri superfamily endonuclease
MKNAVEMGSYAMNIGSGIQKLIGRIHRHTGSIVIS